MTVDKFVTMVEEYYGKYERPAVRKIVTRYLAKLGENFLDRLYQKLVLGYSGQYRYTPDVAILDKYKREVWRDMENSTPHIKQLEGKPDAEQQEEVAQMLHGLTEKLRGATDGDTGDS
jgi:hypothetical protein